MSELTYILNGRKVTRAEFTRGNDSKLRELFRDGPAGNMGTASEGWPRESDSMAVHPKQAKAAEEDARKRGVPTDFTIRGKPIFTGPGHQRQFAKAYGAVDLTERNNTSRVES